MEILGLILAVAAGITSLVCFIIIVIELFKIQGVALGILGIICGIFTFIWGWVKVDEHGKRNIMIIWSIAIVGSIIANVITAAGASASGGY